jgi:dTDP-4-amino-4,6-dideoxygalactose transaminase
VGGEAEPAQRRDLTGLPTRARRIDHNLSFCRTASALPGPPRLPMTQPFLAFAQPDIGDDEIDEVVETLKSGWITTGPKARRFEQDFSAFLGDEGLHSIAVNSATAGLHLALEALGIGPGDEVITTTHTFTATAEVVRYLGADVKLVDIDAATLNIDAAAIEAAITPATRAIVPVHYGGLAADMPAILALAARHRLKVVEDAAHALPTTRGGRLVGTLGSDATVFSFYANKTITTGEGGMLVTRNADIAQRARVMRLHGMNRDAFDRFTATVPSWYYEVVAPGFKYNLGDIAAALGLQQLKKAREFQRKRARIAAAYDAAFAGLPLVTPPLPPSGDMHAWHLYALRLGDGLEIGRDAFIEALYARGIGCSVHYIPLHQHPYWRDRYKLNAAMFPHSQRAYERLVSLPIYTRMGDADVQRVIDAVRDVVRG